MAAFTVHFATPSNGWMQIALSAGDQSLILDVSHVPCNSLSDLLSALLLLQRGSDSETVRWSLEPGYSTWHSTRIDDQIELVIAPFVGANPEFTYRDNSQVVLHSVMKGLCDLAICGVWNPSNRTSPDWLWDFPFDKLSNLKARLKQTRHN